MPTVGIIGAGLIGRAWANVFARAGWDVRLWDPDAAALAAGAKADRGGAARCGQARAGEGPGGGGQARQRWRHRWKMRCGMSSSCRRTGRSGSR